MDQLVPEVQSTVVRGEHHLHLPLGLAASQRRLDGDGPLAVGHVAAILLGQQRTQHVFQRVGVAAQHAHDDADVRLLVAPSGSPRPRRGRRHLVVDVEDAGPVADALDQGPQRVLHHALLEESGGGGVGRCKRDVDEGRLEAVGQALPFLTQVQQVFLRQVGLGSEDDDQGQPLERQPVLLLQIGQERLFQRVADVFEGRWIGIGAETA